MASWAALRAASGIAKSGWPMERLIGSSSVRINSKTRLIPDESKRAARRETVGR